MKAGRRNVRVLRLTSREDILRHRERPPVEEVVHVREDLERCAAPLSDPESCDALGHVRTALPPR